MRPGALIAGAMLLGLLGACAPSHAQTGAAADEETIGSARALAKATQADQLRELARCSDGLKRAEQDRSQAGPDWAESLAELKATCADMQAEAEAYERQYGAFIRGETNVVP